MRIRGGGGGGGGGIPGVTSDNQTPGGEIIAGALQAGYPITGALLFHALYGSTTIRGTQSILDDQDDVLDVVQNDTLSDDNGTYALTVQRHATLNGHNFTTGMALFSDTTSSSVPVVEFSKQGVTQFQVDPDGIRVHGKFKTGASVAHALGAYSGNSVPVYDESGTLLGYMPLYA